MSTLLSNDFSQEMPAPNSDGHDGPRLKAVGDALKKDPSPAREAYQAMCLEMARQKPDAEVMEWSYRKVLRSAVPGDFKYVLKAVLLIRWFDLIR